jgi:hypothetical protein
MPRPQIKNLSIQRIHRQPLAIAAPIFVPAKFEGHIRPLKRPASII